MGFWVQDLGLRAVPRSFQNKTFDWRTLKRRRQKKRMQRRTRRWD